MKRNIYLENTPLERALEIWSGKLDSEGAGPLEGERMHVRDALGGVTAAAVTAVISAPFYHSSAMDGYAVRFSDTFGASESSPKRLKTGEEAVYLNTGEPLPEGFNAVIMIEDVNLIRKVDNEPAAEDPAGHSAKEEFIEITEAATPWQHVRVIGEDIVSTELILPANHEIRPVDMGAMLSGGHVEIDVRRKPVVVIIPTGSELVEPGQPLRKGNIIEYNSMILSSLTEEWGGRALRFDPVADDLDLIKEAILKGCEKGDLVVVNAGSSAGSADYTVHAVAELGEVMIHGINIKPGKPVILGWVRNRPVLGIPGYPVSAFITFQLFAKPLIYRWRGLDCPEPRFIKARLSRQVASPLGQEEFLRVKVGKVGERVIATPVGRGAGVLMSLVRADGMARIPAMSEGVGAGSELTVELFRSEKEIENTIVCIGSHDNTLDLLANVLKKDYPRFSLSSAHVGSLGGLVALKRGEAHMAGTHLLDEETGQYNVPFIKRILGDARVVLVNLVYRQQGLILPKGNPKGIKDFRDLVREDVTFINRQGGAGTRLLTDKYLKELGLSSADVRGYDREEYTHMGVASAVLTGIADVGMGILAAARALDLDFVPLAKERYDLVIPADLLDKETVSVLLDIIRGNREFRNSVEMLGGYDTSDMGKVIYES